MQKKYKGILVSSKIYKERDLLIKFLSDDDELISGIVYGGTSKKKKNIFQIGFFLNIQVNYQINKPPIISAELNKPYISGIINDKYKLSCILSSTSILNISIIEGQTIETIYIITEDFFKKIISNKRWINFYFVYLFKFLKIIGYEIDFNNNIYNKHFDLEKLEFTNAETNSSLYFSNFSFDLNNCKLDLVIIKNLFQMFETILINNHLSGSNLRLPNHYLLFKKLVLDYFVSK